MANREHYFAADMIRFVLNMHKVNWVLREEQNTLSPFTFLHEVGVHACLREWDNAIFTSYQQIHGSHFEWDFRAFIERFVGSPSLLLVDHSFVACTHVARYATLFYNNGVLDAPDVGVEIIGSILLEAAKHEENDIFESFELYCLDLSFSGR